jgi:hypothetical protein
MYGVCNSEKMHFFRTCKWCSCNTLQTNLQVSGIIHAGAPGEIKAVNFKSSKLHPLAKNSKVGVNLSSALLALLILVFCFSMESFNKWDKTLKHSLVICK